MVRNFNALLLFFNVGAITTFILYAIYFIMTFYFNCQKMSNTFMALLMIIQIPIMFTIQWRLCSLRKISKLNLLLYCINPLLSWFVFYLYWYKGPKRLSCEERNIADSRIGERMFIAHVAVLIVVILLIILLSYAYMVFEAGYIRSLILWVFFLVVCVSNLLGGLAIKRIGYSSWLGLTGFVVIFIPLILYLSLPQKPTPST